MKARIISAIFVILLARLTLRYTIITNRLDNIPLKIQYMYYDVENEKLIIHDDFEYDKNFKDCCLFPIV